MAFQVVKEYILSHRLKSGASTASKALPVNFRFPRLQYMLHSLISRLGGLWQYYSEGDLR